MAYALLLMVDIWPAVKAKTINRLGIRGWRLGNRSNATGI
jgi:hypothetical protein